MITKYQEDGAANWTLKFSCLPHSPNFPYSCCFKSPGSPSIPLYLLINISQLVTSRQHYSPSIKRTGIQSWHILIQDANAKKFWQCKFGNLLKPRLQAHTHTLFLSIPKTLCNCCYVQHKAVYTLIFSLAIVFSPCWIKHNPSTLLEVVVHASRPSISTEFNVRVRKWRENANKTQKYLSMYVCTLINQFQADYWKHF